MDDSSRPTTARDRARARAQARAQAALRPGADIYAFALIEMWLELDAKQTRTSTAVDNAVRKDIRESRLTRKGIVVR